MTEYRSIVDPADPNYRSKLADDIQQTMREYNARPRSNDRPRSSSAKLHASPFVWIDPSNIPPRCWLYGRHYIRTFVSATVAPGGVGKSSLAMIEALALATGRNLIGVAPAAKARVWYFNGEDPPEEIQRRFTAAMMHFHIKPEDVAGHLFADSGRNMDLVLAGAERGVVVISVETSDAIKRTIRENKIDVVIVDPFVSSHRVPENDNGAIDAVVKEWGRIADQIGCAVELVHHTRKTGGGEISVEDGRGASALLAAVRSARTLNGMSKDEAEKAGVKHHRLFFRVETGKSNMAPPPPERSNWFQLTSVALGNGATPNEGDEVAVVEKWTWPDVFADVTAAHLDAVLRAVRGGKWRKDAQASDWVGKAVAEALELDLGELEDTSKIKALLKMWMASGALVVREYKDDAQVEALRLPPPPPFKGGVVVVAGFPG